METAASRPWAMASMTDLGPETKSPAAKILGRGVCRVNGSAIGSRMGLSPAFRRENCHIRFLPDGHDDGFRGGRKAARLSKLGAKPALLIKDRQAAGKIDREVSVAFPNDSARPPAIHGS